MAKCFHCHRTAVPGYSLCQAHLKSALSQGTRQAEPVALSTLTADEVLDLAIAQRAAQRQASQPVAAEGAPRSCRMEDGRCGICGGDWSVCGCEGMLRKGAGGADQG